VQWVTSRLLTDLWRIEFGADARPSFAGVDRFGLWESPTGLYFFDPPCTGDSKFYGDMSAWQKRQRLIPKPQLREEFGIAAKAIPAGARVLDVGCGTGVFRIAVPHADYTGIDPHLAEAYAVDGLRAETLSAHLAERAGYYDAVCCFQVLEHVRDPKALLAEIVLAAKPNGLLCVGVPHVPSALSRIPNFLINAPPHHLTWWTEAALVELAKGAGAIFERVDRAPWGRVDSLLYWVERCSPLKCHDVFYRGAVKWHAAALVGFALGTVANALFGPPRRTEDEGAGLMMFARAPSP
jgi:SAM-dependent methyltransferase